MKTLKLSSRFDPAIWVVVAVGLTALGFMTYNHSTLKHAFNEYDFMSTNLDKAEVDLITGHLRLEEHIAGDKSITVEKIRNLFDDSAEQIDKLIESPYAELYPEFFKLLDRSKNLISRFNDVGMERLKDIEARGIGTEIDRRFDIIFDETQIALNATRDYINGHLRWEFKKLYRIYLILLGLWVAVIAGTCLMIYLYSAGRRQAAEALRESEERFRNSFDHTAIGMSLIGHDYEYLKTNRAFCEMVGYSDEELLSMNYMDITHPDDIDINLEQSNKLREGEIDSFQIIKRYIHKQGHTVWCNVSVSVVRDRNGNPIHYISHAENITERKKAEEALVESEEKYRSLFSNMTNGFAFHKIIVDENNKPIDYVFLKINNAFEEMTGLKREQVIGKKVTEIIPGIKDVDPDLIEIYGKVALTRESKKFNIYFEPLSRHYSIAAYSPEKGYFATVFEDITERKHAAEAIKMSERKYRHLFEDANDSIFIADLDDGRFIDVNTVAAERLGYTKEELLDLKVSDINPKEAGDAVKESFERQLAGETITVETSHRRKNGARMPVEVTSKLIDYGGGKAFLAFVRDISERKHAMEDRRRLGKAIDHAADAIIITGSDSRIKYVNPAFEEMTGYSREEAVGQKTSILKSGKHDEAFYSNIQNTILEGGTWKGRIINKKKDGTLFHQEITISPIFNDNKEIISYVGVQRDITQDIIMEDIQKQIVHMQKMEAVGTLAAGIAHDFANILTPIILIADTTIFNLSEESPLRKDMESIIKAANRGKNLVDQVLTFSRRSEVTAFSLEPHLLIKETLNFLRLSLPSTIKLKENINTEQCVIVADPSQINQLVMNLCLNSFHAMSEKGGTLEVTAGPIIVNEELAASVADLEAGFYFKLTVKDTGRGMEPEILEKAFEPFFTTKEKGEGTGLGLSTAHGIVGNLGGTITVKSEPGKGTVFDVYMPASEQKPTDKGVSARLAAKGKSHILLVDDEESIAASMKKMLEMLGYTVTSMTESFEALEVFKRRGLEFDIVITDIVMPFMTGDVLAREIRKIRPDIPIIMITGHADFTEEMARDMGIESYLTKPVSAEDLTEAIQTFTSKKGGNRQ
ncbi:MAG: PAS domain S-box protein [Nitrospinota bacterium]